MRTVALEEHFSVPALAGRIDKGAISRRGYRQRSLPKSGPNPLEQLPEIGAKRLQSMDETGISVQVLSNSGPGPDLGPLDGRGDRHASGDRRSPDHGARTRIADGRPRRVGGRPAAEARQAATQQRSRALR